MKKVRNILLVGAAFSLMLLGDAPPDARFGFQLLPDAHAVFGVWRRHARRWAVVGTSAAVATTAAVASANAAAATSTPPPPSPAPAPAASSGSLPLGTVVSSLPDGCTESPQGGVEYYKCGSNYYRAVFQGNNLVYVTAQP